MISRSDKENLMQNTG